MGDCKTSSLTKQIQSLMRTQLDFPQKLKQRLVLETNRVTNPFKFIASLVNEGVLCDGSSDPEANFGLKEILVQLAIMTACAKGADGIGGLMEALDASGNTKVISALGTWAREDFATGVNGDSSKPKGDVSAGGPSLEMSDKQVQTAYESSSKNYPVLAKSRPAKITKEEPVPDEPKFFEHAAPSDEILKVATFNCQQQPSAKEALTLEFNKKRIIAHLDDSAVYLWNWNDSEAKTIEFGDRVNLKAGETITSFQYDEEVLVVGTSAGTVYLFDTRTFQEKWSIRLGAPIYSLHFVESWIIIRTREQNSIRVWCVELIRSNMQLLNANLFSLGFIHSSNNDITVLNLVDFISTKSNIVAGLQNGGIMMWNANILRLKQDTSRYPDKRLYGHKAAVISLCAINGHLLSLDQSGKLFMWSGYDLENELVSLAYPRILAENFQHVTCLAGYERWFASYSSKEGIISVWALPDMWLRTG